MYHRNTCTYYPHWLFTEIIANKFCRENPGKQGGYKVSNGGFSGYSRKQGEVTQAVYQHGDQG